jgi:thiol:disulfide interchange protein
MIASINDWILALGAQYNVNPYIFAGIYVGAIPFFLASTAWLVKRARAGQSVVMPTLCAGFCFISAYLYLALVGRNVPIWVWIILAALVLFGAWSSIRDVRAKIQAAKIPPSDTTPGERAPAPSD